ALAAGARRVGPGRRPDPAPPRGGRRGGLHAREHGRPAGLDREIVRGAAAGDAFRDRITTTATSLLGLLGVDADPLRSREHILVAKLLETAWREGRDLDLGLLIQQIQQPSFTSIGALGLEAFFPAKDRFELATRLNNLLAAPGFDAWLQ